MQKKLKKNNKKAFTLVEMLIVVVIIGLLMYALLGNTGFFNKDSVLPEKMNLLAQASNKCLQELSENYSIDTALKAYGKLLVNSDTLTTDSNTLSNHKKLPKGTTYDITGFYNMLGNDKSYCKDFITNLSDNVGKKWSVEAWYIPSNVPGNITEYIDADYGGFLVCAVSSSKKYAEFQDANKENKYYTCSILGLNGQGVGQKASVSQAFGGDGKHIIKTSDTTPEIPTN